MEMLRELEAQILKEMSGLSLLEKIRLQAELAKKEPEQKSEAPAEIKEPEFDLFAKEEPIPPVLYTAIETGALIAKKLGFAGEYSEQAISAWYRIGRLSATPLPLNGRYKYKFSERQIDDFVQKAKNGEFPFRAPHSRNTKKEEKNA